MELVFILVPLMIGLYTLKKSEELTRGNPHITDSQKLFVQVVTTMIVTAIVGIISFVLYLIL